MNYPPSLILLIMILLSPLSHADPREDDDNTPSLELLEFLGEWETQEGAWIDPAELEDDDYAKFMSLTDEEGKDHKDDE